MSKVLYYVGYAFGYCSVKLFKCIVNLFVKGIIRASQKNKVIMIMYIVLSLCAITFLMAFHNPILFLLIFIMSIATGIWVRVEDYPLEKKQVYFKEIFEEIGLVNKNKLPPYYLYEEETALSIDLVFQTTIPLSEWEKHRDSLEMCLNETISGIEQDPNNKQRIHLIIQLEALPEVLEWNESFLYDSNTLSIGITNSGIIGMNLEKYPHCFIAGETGCGKSNLLKCLIHQSLMKEYEVVLVDFKRGVSFSEFTTAVNIYYEHGTALKVLEEQVEETKQRLDSFRESKVDNIKDYNEVSGQYLSRRIIFIDELAELGKRKRKKS